MEFYNAQSKIHFLIVKFVTDMWWGITYVLCKWRHKYAVGTLFTPIKKMIKAPYESVLVH